MTVAKERAKPDPAVMVAKLTPAVKVLLKTKAFAEIERERVEKIERAVLEAGNYLSAKKWEPKLAVHRITEPKQAYLLEDADSDDYFAKVKAIHLANGYAAAAEGKCPACVAEYAQTKAEWALMDAAEEFFPGTKDRVYGPNREKYLHLLVGLVVKYPGFKM